MKTEYLPSFIKDLKKLKKTAAYSEVKTLTFQTIPNIKNISEIKNIKKMKGYRNAYRIRVGDYRIGILVQQNTITFFRILHRKDIYRYFP